MMTGHPESPQSASPCEGPRFPLKSEPQSDSDDGGHQAHYVVLHTHSASLQHSQVTQSSPELESPSLPNELVPPPDSTVHTLQSTNGYEHHSHMLQHLQRVSMGALETDYSPPVPLPPSATPVVHVKLEARSPEPRALPPAGVKIESFDMNDQCAVQGTTLDMDRHMTVHGHSSLNAPSAHDFLPLLHVKDEPLSEGEQPLLSGEDTNDSSSGLSDFAKCGGSQHGAGGVQHGSGPKTWTQQDMDSALEALRSHNMSLTKASATYGIPSTTLWQRAHRLGIDTPKKEGSSKTWSEADLHNALHALRTGAISANKASKAYGIPSSTLYKIARREGIRLAAPFNAAPTAWRPSDLERALHSIRSGLNSVQRASTEFGIPTGTLYGRCKREGIELSRSNPTPWSEDAMGEALEAVRVGQMSINQAAIHYNLPYSSLYGRFKRCKYEPDPSLMAAQHAPAHHMQQPAPSMQHPHTEPHDLEPPPDLYPHSHYPHHHMPHASHMHVPTHATHATHAQPYEYHVGYPQQGAMQPHNGIATS